MPPRSFISGKVMGVGGGRSHWPFVDNAMSELRGGCTEFAHPPGVARQAARRHYRLAQTMGLHYVAEAGEFQRRLEVAQNILTELAGLASRDAEAGVAARKEAAPSAHCAPMRHESIEVGDVLIAHPCACVLEEVFDRSVIIIDAVDEDQGTVRGVVINKPFLNTTLRALLLHMPQAKGAELGTWADDLGPLLDMPLYLGGPVLEQNLSHCVSWLHEYGDRKMGVRDSRKIAPNLWHGGNTQQVSAMALAHPSKLRMFLAHASWLEEQLRNELERGVWVHARPHETTRLGSLLPRTASTLHIWQALMRGAGMEGLAAFPRGRLADRRLVKLIQLHYQEDRKEQEEEAKQKTQAGSSAQMSGGAEARVKDPEPPGGAPWHDEPRGLQPERKAATPPEAAGEPSEPRAAVAAEPATRRPRQRWLAVKRNAATGAAAAKHPGGGAGAGRRGSMPRGPRGVHSRRRPPRR
eukprot:NODE_5240_length_1793_cov_11.990996.p1 GENE.NODE_5240_length_1793_cov_11.990996~~NODE_5240_length_1793_cov_11.990996.p1  ORF type:complete len:510 (+),score=104.57 NODE_5240_length_1793_cov_11.990996:133-1530(+)